VVGGENTLKNSNNKKKLFSYRLEKIAYILYVSKVGNFPFEKSYFELLLIRFSFHIPIASRQIFFVLFYVVFGFNLICCWHEAFSFFSLFHQVPYSKFQPDTSWRRPAPEYLWNFKDFLLQQNKFKAKKNFRPSRAVAVVGLNFLPHSFLVQKGKLETVGL